VALADVNEKIENQTSNNPLNSPPTIYRAIKHNRSLKVALQGLDFMAHPLYIHTYIHTYRAITLLHMYACASKHAHSRASIHSRLLQRTYYESIGSQLKTRGHYSSETTKLNTYMQLLPSERLCRLDTVWKVHINLKIQRSWTLRGFLAYHNHETACCNKKVIKLSYFSWLRACLFEASCN
jgi:hypothetical protein